MVVSTSMASCAAAGRGDIRGEAVARGGNGGVPCGGVILIAGGALIVSTSMAVGVAGVAGGGGAEDFGVVEVTGGDRCTRCRQGGGRGAGGRGGVSSGGKGRSSRAFWDRQGGCWGAHIHHRGRMRRFCWRGSWALG